MLVLILSGMVLIVLSADYFTNGVEWLGRGLGLGQSAVGTLLAALGTALPETLVPVLAILAGAGARRIGVGLGAILGAPFMLATLGFGVLGVGSWWFGRHRAPVSIPDAVGRDLRFFVAAFSAALLASLLPPAVRPYAGVALVLFYLGFARYVLLSADSSASEGQAVPLHFWQGERPPMLAAAAQVALGLMGLVVGAHFFVRAVTELAVHSGISGFVLSVLLTPVATELPEVLNSIIWLKRRQDILAFGNVTGAMAFQASLVPALGIWLTPWKFSSVEWAVGALAVGAALWTLLMVGKQRKASGLMLGGGAYLLAAAGLVLAAVRL
jgi:cation:H+ antiporter